MSKGKIRLIALMKDATSTEGKTEAVAEQPRYNIGTLVVRKETKPGQALNRKTADVKSEAAPDTKISDGMKEDEWWCEICGNKIDHPPQYCCNGFDCGCRGLPTGPPVCSEKCYDKFVRKVQRKESK